MSNKDFDFVKTKSEEPTLLPYEMYNNKFSQNLSNDVFIALQNLSKNKVLLIKKSIKCYIVENVARQDNIRKTKNIISNPKVFTNSMTKKETKKSFKHGGSRLDVMHGSCKIDKANVEIWLLFLRSLLTLNTPTYKLANFSSSILNFFKKTKNYHCKRLFSFCWSNS